MGVQSNGKWLFDWPVDYPHKLTRGFINDGNGLDIVTDTVRTFGLKPIYAAESGTVDQIQHWDGKTKTGMGSYGNMVRINHGMYDGHTLQTRYAHMSKLLVNKGESVYPGDIIGYMGSTGNATEEYLNFEVIWNGKLYNPLDWLDDNFIVCSSVVNGKYHSVKYNNFIIAGPISSVDLPKVVVPIIKYSSVTNGTYSYVKRDNANNLYYINAGPLSSRGITKVTDLLKELNIHYITE